MISNKSLPEMLQYAVSIVEQQVAETGDFSHGQQDDETWEVLVVVVQRKGDKRKIHASSSESAFESSLIALNFARSCTNPDYYSEAKDPPKPS